MKIKLTIIIAMWQILICIYTHKKNNPKFELFNLIYQAALFIIFQIMIWIIF